MQPLKALIELDDIIELEQTLGNTPFCIEDLYFESPYFVSLDKGLFYNLFHQFDNELLQQQLNGLIKRYEVINQLEADKNYRTIFGTWLEKRVLIEKFLEYYLDIPDKDKYEIFIDVYKRSEYGFNHYIDESFLKKLIKYRPSNHLPSFNQKLIKVYRGNDTESTSPNEAFSWTLNIDVAKWFSKRFEGQGEVYEAFIEPKNIFAHITTRNEDEIIVFPSHLKEIKLTEDL